MPTRNQSVCCCLCINARIAAFVQKYSASFARALISSDGSFQPRSTSVTFQTIRCDVYMILQLLRIHMHVRACAHVAHVATYFDRMPPHRMFFWSRDSRMATSSITSRRPLIGPIRRDDGRPNFAHNYLAHKLYHALCSTQRRLYVAYPISSAARPDRSLLIIYILSRAETPGRRNQSSVLTANTDRLDVYANNRNIPFPDAWLVRMQRAGSTVRA